MTVFVDPPVFPYGRMKMCHMIADTEQELHEMADAIGVNRKWYQRKASFPHYDICKSKRAIAVELGAQEVTSKELVLKIRDLRKKK